MNAVLLMVLLAGCGEHQNTDAAVNAEAMPPSVVVASAVVAPASGINAVSQPDSPLGDWQCAAWQSRASDTVASFRGIRAITTDGKNFYVADAEGRSIRKVEVATGQVTTLAGSGKEGYADGVGTAALLGMIIGLATDGKVLYAADIINKKIRKIDLANGQVTTLPISVKTEAADGVGTTGVQLQGALALVGNSLYVSYGTNIRKIDLDRGQMSIFAGQTNWSRPGKDGIGSAASFTEISQMVTDGENLYVIGRGISDVRKVAIATGQVSTILPYSLNYPQVLAVSGKYLYSTDHSALMQIEIATGQTTALANRYNENPQGLAATLGLIAPTAMIAVGDKLYLAQVGKGEFSEIDLANRTIFPLAGLDETGATDGAGAVPSLNVLGISANGNSLYFSDSGNNAIRDLELATGAVKTIAGSNTAGETNDIGNAAAFSYPQSVTSDGNSLYVADYNNHLIRKIVLATGEVSTLAGSGKPGKADGIGKAASFNYPRSIVSDGSNLYVADYDNHAIRKIEIATGSVSTLAGSGKEGKKDGVGADASFQNPRGIAIDGTALYVADTYNHTIRKVDIATRRVTTLAGTGNEGAADDIGAAASFSYPQNVVTHDGNLYVTDYGNNSIRKIALATGAVTTLAGSGKPGAKDGAGTAASFSQPSGMATDGKNLYVADTRYNTLRKIEIATGSVTTLVGATCISGTVSAAAK